MKFCLSVVRQAGDLNVPLQVFIHPVLYLMTSVLCVLELGKTLKVKVKDAYKKQSFFFLLVGLKNKLSMQVFCKFLILVKYLCERWSLAPLLPS